MIVAKYDIAQWEGTADEDFYYLMYEVSSIDAAPEIAKIDLDDKKWNLVENEFRKQSIYNYFLFISEENEGIFFREANYSRIRAKMAADKYLEEHKDDVNTNDSW